MSSWLSGTSSPVNLDTELPEHVLHWALNTLKIAVHRNLEGTKAHYDSYGTYEVDFYHSIFTLNLGRYLIFWCCYERARNKQNHGFSSHGSDLESCNLLSGLRGEC